jgi:hypothetical protein
MHFCDKIETNQDKLREKKKNVKAEKKSTRSSIVVSSEQDHQVPTADPKVVEPEPMITDDNDDSPMPTDDRPSTPSAASESSVDFNLFQVRPTLRGNKRAKIMPELRACSVNLGKRLKIKFVESETESDSESDDEEKENEDEKLETSQRSTKSNSLSPSKLSRMRAPVSPVKSATVPIPKPLVVVVNKFS